MTDLEFVKAVRARLLEYGHTTGLLGPPEGPNCLLGAAYNVLGLRSRRLGTVNLYDGLVNGPSVAEEQVEIEYKLRHVLGVACAVATFNDTCPTKVISRLDAYIAAHDREPVHA